MPNPDIRIRAIRPLPTGNLKAYVSVQVGDLVIHDFRIVQQPGQRAYVSVPQREYMTNDARRAFQPLVELTTDLKAAISQAVLAAWDHDDG